MKLFGILFSAYMPLRSLGQSGQSLVVTLDRIKIECPVNGTPGPEIIYWQRGVEADAEKLVIVVKRQLKTLL